MLDAISQALQYYARLDIWVIMLSGIIIGLIVGILPGIGGLVATALILPFVFVMGLERSLILMMSVTAITATGGSITAVLLNIPGEPANVATVLDGYPMTQKGEAGRALGAALTASAVGCIISALIALAVIPLVLPMVMGLRMADMVFIILLGIVFIAVLSKGSTIKGLISGAFGLLFSTVGYQASTGIERFSFGSAYLYEGIALVPVILGLFALPEMIVLAVEGGAIARGQAIYKGVSDVWRGVKDVFRHWTLTLRSTIIGFIAGVVPGVGGSVAAFVAYGQAKQTSKHPETFGTGNVEGVVAPETSNNAKEAGALLTTLALGIPGSPHFAIFLGALIMAGVVPGPDMFTKHLGLSLTLMSIILVAGIIGTTITLPFCAHFAKVAFVPARFLVPLTLVLIFAGAYVFQSSAFDLLLVLIFGAIGFFMTRYKWNHAAFILGFILGSQFEHYLFLSYKIDGPLFFMTPISLGLILINIALLVYEPIRDVLQPQKRKGMSKVMELRDNTYAYIVILAVMLFVVGWSLRMEYFENKVMPILLASLIFVLAAIGLVRGILARGELKSVEADAEVTQAKTGEKEWWRYLLNGGWIASFALAIYLLGFLIAVPLLVLCYMKCLGTRWRVAAIFAALTPAFLYGLFEVALQIQLHQGVVLRWSGY